MGSSSRTRRERGRPAEAGLPFACGSRVAVKARVRRRRADSAANGACARDPSGRRVSRAVIREPARPACAKDRDERDPGRAPACGLAFWLWFGRTHRAGGLRPHGAAQGYGDGAGRGGGASFDGTPRLNAVCGPAARPPAARMSRIGAGHLFQKPQKGVRFRSATIDPGYPSAGRRRFGPSRHDRRAPRAAARARPGCRPAAAGCPQCSSGSS